MSELGVGGMAVEVEPSHQYSVILLPCDRWQQRGSLTKWKRGWSKGVSLNSSTWKKVTAIDVHQCLLNVYGDHIVDVSTVRQWVVRFSSGDTGPPPLVQIFMSVACRLLVITRDSAQLMVVPMFQNSAL